MTKSNPSTTLRIGGERSPSISLGTSPEFIEGRSRTTKFQTNSKSSRTQSFKEAMLRDPEVILNKSLHSGQIPMTNNKTKVLLFGICMLSCLFCYLCFGICYLFAQEDLAKLKETYFKENKYSEFIDYLKDLKKKAPSADVSYYIALTRYQQLKYLEETQSWNEYFSLGDEYRKELTDELKNSIGSTSTVDSLGIYARCLLWQFYKDQDDTLESTTREDLINSTIKYATENKDIEPVRYVADTLFLYGNKGHAKKLYNIYAQQLIELETSEDKLKAAAYDAYQKENLPLATTIYDAYIEKITKSYTNDKSAPILISIAKDFLYKDRGSYDAEYAEKIFKSIEQLAGKEAIDEELRYLRAYNLEKSKEYLGAEGQYRILIEDFPQSKYYDEAVFKIGMINTYVSKDINKGSSYFEKLSQKSSLSAQVISSLYQLGILSQWQKDFTRAKEYYLKLTTRAGSDFLDTQELAQQRLKEIEKAEEMEYNLKMFLDASFSNEPIFDMSRIDLRSHPYRLPKEQSTEILASAYMPESGCMSVEVKYLWSGHLGTATPTIDQQEFPTSYKFPGTKEINLVVVTSAGVLDRSFIMVEAE